MINRLSALPVRISERIGLLEPVQEPLPPGARMPKHTFRWDLDKTYLRTEFDSLADLAKSAIETAADKRAFPGATALLRALVQEGNRICIVSGSPTQMRNVLAAKLALDGIDYDEFVLKNNLKNILRGRFRALRAQIPYKLPAMLQSRINALTTDVIARDDPAQKAVLEKQRLRALDEFKRLTEQVAKDQQAIADIEEDARKQGIPPGWIR